MKPDAALQKSLIDHLAPWPEVSLIILFGSLAAGQARADSDLDLAIDLGRPLEVREKMAMIETLADLTGRPIDLIDLRTVGEPLLGEILAGGIRLAGSDEAYAELALKHIYAVEDFVPYQQRILRERREAWLGK